MAEFLDCSAVVDLIMRDCFEIGLSMVKEDKLPFSFLT
jgi:hypothetical protein